jgi:hypothetical protein
LNLRLEVIVDAQAVARLAAIISRASAAVSEPNNGKSGVNPLPASFSSR